MLLLSFLAELSVFLASDDEENVTREEKKKRRDM